jgi:DNA-binding transcriptional ArsR family regulator
LTGSIVSYNLPFVATYQASAIEALADPSRRAIFELLGDGPRSVVDLAAAVPISRPAVSQHLKVLKEAGLVSVRSAGTRRIYGLDPAGVATVREYFERFWTSALTAYAQLAEEAAQSSEAPSASKTTSISQSTTPTNEKSEEDR